SEELAFLGRQTGSVNTVGITPDGKSAFAGGQDGALRFWDLKTRQQSTIIPHSEPIVGASFCNDGQSLVTCTDHQLCIREWPSQRIKTTITNQWFRPNTLIFSPNQKLLAFGSYYTGVTIWDLEGEREVGNLPFDSGYMAPIGLSFSPDGETVAYN